MMRSESSAGGLDAETVDDPVDARRDAADLAHRLRALLDQLDQLAHRAGEIAHRREALIDAGILLPDGGRDLAHGPGIVARDAAQLPEAVPGVAHARQVGVDPAGSFLGNGGGPRRVRPDAVQVLLHPLGRLDRLIRPASDLPRHDREATALLAPAD